MPDFDARSAPEIAALAPVGDGRSCALISRDGAVEWLSWPRFDAPTIFASLLDRERGGSLVVRPLDRYRSERRYRPGTNVLETRFVTDTGEVRVIDCMPVAGRDGPVRPECELIRRIEGLRGSVRLGVRYAPRPGYGLAKVRFEKRGRLGWFTPTRLGVVHLRSTHELQPRPGDALGTELVMKSGGVAELLLGFSEGPAILPPHGEPTLETIDVTTRAWRAWSARTQYEGPWRDAVVRSALVLKLLTFAPTGAIVAAPTSSLPERLGGTLNWDSRYCRLRNASLTARALFSLGHHDEGRQFVEWLLHATRLTRPRLEVLYDVYGRAPRPERELPFLEGYRGASPVRVGNAAQRRNQLDVYGEVIDAAAWSARHGASFDKATAAMLADFGNEVRAHWMEPDNGISELRRAPRHRTRSRMLAWAALDRLVALHDTGLIHLKDRRGVFQTRERIRLDIERRGFNQSLGAYSGELDRPLLDASLLLAPHFGYAPASATRMRATVRALRQGLAHRGGPLIHRTSETTGGAFVAGSFWLAECLALDPATRAEAGPMFRALLGKANDLGLFAEEIDPVSGVALGNFPQAFSHVGLITAANALEATRVEAKHGQAAPSRARPPALKGSEVTP